MSGEATYGCFHRPSPPNPRSLKQQQSVSRSHDLPSGSVSWARLDPWATKLCHLLTAHPATHGLPVFTVGKVTSIFGFIYSFYYLSKYMTHFSCTYPSCVRTGHIARCDCKGLGKIREETECLVNVTHLFTLSCSSSKTPFLSSSHLQNTCTLWLACQSSSDTSLQVNRLKPRAVCLSHLLQTVQEEQKTYNKHYHLEWVRLGNTTKPPSVAIPEPSRAHCSSFCDSLWPATSPTALF